MMLKPMIRTPLAFGFLLILAAATAAFGQIFPPGGVIGSSAPGVLIDAEGNVSIRAVDARDELAAVRARARGAAAAAKGEKLAFVSLPKAFAQARAAVDGGKDVPEAVKYLQGMTQVRYVFVDSEAGDLVVAGPAEPWVVNGINAVGKISGRPTLQLEDLVVAMRTARDGGGRLFGCGIYPNPNSLKAAEEIALKMARATRKQRADALTAAMGPQEVRIFGTAADTRIALICVGADYQLKRIALGLDVIPGAAIGHAVDNSRSAANKFWFETSYEPLLVSKDGASYGIRGQRLKVSCGMFDFDPRGATEKAKAFAGKFSKEMPAIAVAMPLVAELQNVADWALVANLMRIDRLPQKAGWEVEWALDGYPVTKVPAPKTADTLVNFTSGSMVAGGVIMQVSPWIAPGQREADDKGLLSAPRKQWGEAAQPATRPASAADRKAG